MRRASIGLGQHLQQGVVRVQADLISGRSRLVGLACASPARLLPLHPAGAERAGAAWCSLTTFGGGLLGGDGLEATVGVGPGAALVLVTQGAARVYRTKRDGKPAEQSLQAQVGAGGLLVSAPDPVVPFAGAAFVQRQRFRLHAERAGAPAALGAASVVVVDWLGAGRVAAGERWAFGSYFTRSQYDVLCAGSGPESVRHPWLVEALALHPACGGDGLAGGVGPDSAGLNAAASIVALGPRAQEVAGRLLVAASQLAARSGARIVERASDGGVAVLPELAGRAHMGATAVPARPAAGAGAVVTAEGCTGAVARVVAERTDDVYRLLHFCLEPLEGQLGGVPYSDRVHGVGAPGRTRQLGRHVPRSLQGSAGAAGPIAKVEQPLTPAPKAPARMPTQAVLGPLEQMRLLQLADAALPTGAFAHSGGLEAAAQLGLLAGHEELRAFLLASARSSQRLQGVFAAAAHRAAAADPSMLSEWWRLDKLLHAHLACNAAACRASQEQGAALARALVHWSAAVPALAVVREPARGHLATVFGLAGVRLGLPRQVTIEALAYCGIRDAVSAAVRLNLVGPLAGVEMQAGLLEELAPELLATPEGIHEAASSAPLVDCAQAAHEMLHARLFLT